MTEVLGTPPARSVSEALKKMHLFLSLRPSVFAPACGSAEWNSTSPVAAAFGVPIFTQGSASLHPGLFSIVPPTAQHSIVSGVHSDEESLGRLSPGLL